MYNVELRYSNGTRTIPFANEAGARVFAGNLMELFDGEECWREETTYIVTIPKMEIN